MKKLLVLGVLILILIGVAASIDYRTRRIRVRVNVTDVDKDIREHLSVGASRAEVESFLDKRAYEHSYVKRSRPEPEPSPKEYAMVRESSQSWLIRGDIQIVFDFDNQDKLIRYSLKEIFTGP